MARPITWQDVAAPNTGAALAASQAASDSIVNSLRGLGNVAGGYVQGLKDDATKQAVASIMQSADPAAAAAQVAQSGDWRVDPLAVAAAAAQTDQRLRQNKALDASLEASQVSTETNREQLADLRSSRAASTIATDFITGMRADGDISKVDFTKDERFKGPEGDKALQIILAESHNRRKLSNEESELELRRIQAQREKFNETLLKNQMNAQGEFYNWAANEGQGADPGKIAAKATEIAQTNDLPASYTEQLVPLHQTAASRFVPTGTQLGEKVPGQEYTYRDIDNTLRTAESAAATQHAANIGKFEQLNNISANLAKSPYEGMTDSQAALELAKNYGWDADDASERMQRAQARAPKGVTLTVAQKAEVAALTNGSWIGGVKDNWANSDAAKARLNEYVALQQEGGAGVVQEKLGKFQNAAAQDQANFQRQRNMLNQSARSGEDAPAALVKEFSKQREAQRKELLARQRQAEKDSEEAQRQIDKALQRERATQYVPSTIPRF